MKRLIILTLLATTFLIGCNDNSSGVLGTGNSATTSMEINLEALRANIGIHEIQDLSEEEIAGLLLMREEEKLARDVYLTLGEQYDLRIFNKIAASEQNHTDAVLLLLDRYGIADPVGENPIGVFQDEVLQALYDDLIAQGSQSLESALYVGCAIEEIDIKDLHELMADTQYEDLLLVYGHLLDGSCRHLRAYVRLWEQQSGQEYEPRFLSVEDYEAIINAGGAGGGGNGHGGNGHGGGNRH